MKISLWIPRKKSVQWITNFINKEITQASNIKSKQNRESIQRDLLLALVYAKPGSCLYVGDGFANISEYTQNEFKYHCGKEFQYPEKPSEFK